MMMMMMMKKIQRLTVIIAAAAANTAALKARETAAFELEQNDEYDNSSDKNHSGNHDQRYLPRLQHRVVA